MAVRPASRAGRLAVERARLRLPELSPDSIEVVELVRGKHFVVLRDEGDEVAVLDERGRLVRSPSRLAAIGQHLRACAHLHDWARGASLAERLENAAVGLAAIDDLRTAALRGVPRSQLHDLVDGLRELSASIDTVLAELGRSLSPTERTLKRTIGWANEAARADRNVVRATRVAAARLGAEDRLRRARAGVSTPFSRWAVTRLAAPDLPFLYPELSEREDAAAVSAFVAAARARST